MKRMIKMSKKIYNGYILKNMSLLELNEFRTSMKEKIKKRNLLLYERRISRIALGMIDNFFLLDKHNFIRKHIQRDGISFEMAEKEYECMSILKLSKKIIEEKFGKIRKTGVRDCDFDFECNAVFIPLQDKILTLFYTENNELIKVWKEDKNVEEYGYWNNSDKPEKHTDEEWKLRENDWNKVFEESLVPSDSGFIVEFSKELPSLNKKSIENIVKYLPSLEERSYKISKEKVLIKKGKEFTKKAEQKGGEIVFFDIIEGVEKWFKSDEGQQEIENAKFDVKKQIVGEIKDFHLTMSFKELELEKIKL